MLIIADLPIISEIYTFVYQMISVVKKEDRAFEVTVTKIT